MADKKTKKKKKENNESSSTRWHDGLKDETKYSIFAVISLGVSFFLILSIFNTAGVAGEYSYTIMRFLFGAVLYLVPAVFFAGGIVFLSSVRPRLLLTSIIGSVLMLLSVLSIVDIIFDDYTGGFVGFAISWPFLWLIDFWASLILFFVVFVIGALIMFNFPLSFIQSLFQKKFKQEKLFPEDDLKNTEEFDKNIEPEKESFKESLPEEEGLADDDYDKDGSIETVNGNEGFLSKAKTVHKKFMGKKFEPPPLDLLETDKGKPSTGDIKANANIIKRTLQNFNINVEMNEVCIGPSVTQYTLKPAEGVKLARITSLSNDLALALAAHPIRIEAPIPGKSLVGIEVPNRTSSLVGLGSLLGQDDYKKSVTPLLLSLGRNVAGRPVFDSLGKMPHLLIAGATGSGKSVCIHSLMMSLLFRHAPWELQFLMIDPKRVELTIYNDLPYLLTPVITDAKKAIMALKWATKEMERRYDVLLEAGARDIHSYHKKKSSDSMPYIIVVIDELADIMATYPREFEASIVRLAQMSRAVGIHLLVSTQRPSVEVITGLIKANITTRIAFQVASQVDSRTILDMAGAEKLLGNGDMLYLSGDSSKPRRIQGAFVSEREVRQVADYLVDEYEDLDMFDLKMGNGEMEQVSMFENGASFEGEEEDELYEEARDLVIKAGKASSSYLQRRLRIGYARAARLVDMLEERGVVGPADGSKPREILIVSETEEEF